MSVVPDAPAGASGPSGRSGKPGRPGRRWWRPALVVVACVVLLCLVATAGIAWYFSGQVVDASRPSTRPHVASPAGPDAVALTGDAAVRAPGLHSVEWEGGSVRVGELRGAATTAGDGTVGATRAVVPGSARGTALRPGTPAVVDGNAFEGDPRSALGLSFDQLDVRGELGAMPAWFVPPGTGSTGGTWIVFVHGRGGTREESLRYLPGWHRLGLPVLVPTYRNDVGAPAAPDRQDHLGDTEWRDVEAAVRLALDRGARDVVLAGWSMGGAISLQVADRSALRPRIRGLLLDAPVVDWHDVLAAQGRQRGLPSLLTRAAVVTAEQRVDVDLDRFDWVARAGDLRVPVLLHHGLDDDVVPPGPSQALAAARPDLVTLRLVPRAGHTRSWNVDPAGYEAVTSAWLTRLGAAPVPAN